MKVLFIGGTGTISSACSQLALEQGIDLYLFNRGLSARPVPKGAKVINGNIRDLASTRKALGDQHFDVVVNWVNYTLDQVETDFSLFQNRTSQYVFISSASAYQSPPSHQPVDESTILDNPYWQYSRDKIACEEFLVRVYRQEKFPITIVRPSHTYDCRLLPFEGGWTVVDRMLKGKQVIVHGDGASIWTLTHHQDFARGFNALLGNSKAIGETVQITSDEWLTWNQIFEAVASAAGVKADLVHVPSDLINAYDPEWGAGLLGDKTHSMMFDNAKIKRLAPGFFASIPFSVGAKEIVNWYLADPSRQKVDETFNQTCERILLAYSKAWPQTAG